MIDSQRRTDQLDDRRKGPRGGRRTTDRPGKHPVVLVADSDDFARRPCVQFLTRRGFLVCEASAGAEAIRSVPALRPDVVLVDMVMPSRDGINAIQTLRPLLPHTHFVALSCLLDANTARAALDAGVCCYMMKTATPHDLVILTGDVHFGRVASCTLPSGRRIVELIASPLALVSPLVGGHWKATPGMFPAIPVPGVVQVPLTNEAYQQTANHAMTVGFSGVGQAVRLKATSWPIRPRQPAVGTVVHTTDLH